MKKYNVAVVGYGWAAGAHIGAINAGPLAQVTRVCSSRPLDAAELSARHGSSISVTRSLEEVLDDFSVDVVDITSYPWQHAAHVIAAAKAGKHIIVEKPLVLSLKDLRAVEKAVRAAGVKLCICFECRWAGHFRTVKSMIDGGLLGKLHYGEVDYYHGIGPWYGQYRWNVKRKGGGSSLLTAGCHALDALLLCLGGDVEEVTSYDTGSSHPIFKKYEYTTTSVTLLKLSSGAVGKCAAVVDCFQPYYFHTHLVGSHGSILDNKFHSQKIEALDKSRWSQLSMKLVDSGDVADHPYQSQFDAFFAALEKGKDMPLTSLADAVRTHEVVFAADLSAREGRPVKLKEVQGRK